MYRPSDIIRATKQECIALAKEAAIHKMFVNVGKQWFSPNEFRRIAEKIPDDERSSFDREKIKIKDPVSAIMRMRNALDEYEKTYAEFAYKVAIFYQSGGNV